ncbi:MAG: hypothetical protein K9J12_12230 [Melioribacteraceae bacterium]|nr:hypothetical protein [Melioribacteraceae bacterium]MCF8263750.1 hypothetical protein [Melioribacteraceae bacterium]MCF8412669.1 hypothetical protein [Melioribacteraceae bacterium]MCF8430985.1 hypothetical protein [Melioribacteraceae bacterium]
MGTGQTLLSICAFSLLSVLVLRVSNTFLTTNSMLMDTKFGVLAVSLATSLIEEANSKAFDTKTDSAFVGNLNDLTPALGLGPAMNENHLDYNDFDDYNGYSQIDSTMPSAIFNVSAVVTYINPSSPELVSNTPTWHKRITVMVSSESMKDTIQISSIFSYWYFR